jgi:hypothetical protein
MQWAGCDTMLTIAERKFLAAQRDRAQARLMTRLHAHHGGLMRNARAWVLGRGTWRTATPNDAARLALLIASCQGGSLERGLCAPLADVAMDASQLPREFTNAAALQAPLLPRLLQLLPQLCISQALSLLLVLTAA